MTLTKLNRAEQIAGIIETVALYYGVSASKVLTAFAPKNPLVAQARVTVWSHLQSCGMSWCAIGRIFDGLSVDNVQRRTKQWRIRATDEERLLLASLPKIETTLKITQARP